MDSPTSRQADRSADTNGNANSHANSNGLPPEKKPSVFHQYAPYFWVGGLGLLALGAGIGFLFFVRPIFGVPFKGPTWTAKKEVLRVTIVERGSLESAEN